MIHARTQTFLKVRKGKTVLFCLCVTARILQSKENLRAKHQIFSVLQFFNIVPAESSHTHHLSFLALFFFFKCEYLCLD